MNRTKVILMICCCFILVFSFSVGVAAEETSLENRGGTELLSTGVFDENTSFTYPSLFPVYNKDTQTYEDTTYFVPGPVTSSGIDVSSWQGKIDWEAVADEGVNFVLVRVGYRGYGTGKIGEDKYFRENIEGAQKAGIRVGAYIYSQAITEDEAREEAAYLMHKVADYQMDMPLVFDYEFSGAADGRLRVAYRDGALNAEKGTDICLAFCDYVKSFGYDAMVYANASMLTSHLEADRLEENADIWLANYARSTVYTNDFDYWQYASTGQVDGVKGDVDCNFAFVSKLYQSGSGCFPFVDAVEGDWFYDEVKYAYDHDLFNGTQWNKFSPNATMTRAMLVSVLYRMEGSPAVSGSTAFTDVTGDWYKNAVVWANQNGIVSGTGPTSFSPDEPVTREQMAALLYRYAAYKGYNLLGAADLGSFSDHTAVSDYAVPAMKWTVAKGYIAGFPNGILGPQKGATRGEVAAILERFCIAKDLD